MPETQLVYIPGMDGTGTLFYRQAAELEYLFEIYCVQLEQTAAETWLSLTEQVIQVINPERPVVFCGESFGACLALLLALDARCQTTGLILVNPATSAARQFWGTSARTLLSLMPEPVFKWLTPQGLRFLAELDQIDGADQKQLAMAANALSSDVMARRVKLLWDFRAEQLPLESLAIPTLLLAGCRDKLLPSVEEVHRLAQRLPQAKISISSASGHACLLERHLSLKARLLEQDLLIPKAAPTP